MLQNYAFLIDFNLNSDKSMITSMTGFGSVQFENDQLMALVEVKSLNSKFLDINFRLPRNFPAEKELVLRNLLKDELQRGKIAVTLDYQLKGGGQTNSKLNFDVLKSYYISLKEAAQKLGANESDVFRIATLMPDVLQPNLMSEEDNNENWEILLRVFKESLEKCKSFRADEGKVLGESFEENILKIRNALKQVEDQDPQRVENIKQRLESRIKDIGQNEMFDRNRFEQEMIYFIEKLDITEEKVRLKNHLDYFLETLKNSEDGGKKLNFISQEIGREINTIGSKANDAMIQRYVVEMKEELDKIKEQVLNIL
jgi:uncharacterized protein (TIGR00255 family)